MAKNKNRKNAPAPQAVKKSDEPVRPAEEIKEAAEAAVSTESNDAPKTEEKSSKNSSKKKKDALYQIKTKRTSDILKAYIMFTYRISNPGVTARLVLYGLLVAAPGVFYFKDLFWKIFFIVIGIALVLLGFFRQYISLSITKKNDPDYINKSDFTYDFYDMSATVSKNGEIISRMTNYKSITAFFYDDAFYYLALGKEVHVLPKKAFTVGDPAEFEEFIYKKSKKTCKWLPVKLSDRIKKRRAERAVASGDLFE